MPLIGWWRGQWIAKERGETSKKQAIGRIRTHDYLLEGEPHVAQPQD